VGGIRGKRGAASRVNCADAPARRWHWLAQTNFKYNIGSRS
jgi:hypothetical protein